MVKRNGILLMVVASLLLGLVVWSGEAQPTLRLTYNPMPFNLPSMVELDQQFLANAGVTVDYNTFLVGYAMTEAMAARELDMAVVMGGTSAITSRAGGRSIKVIGGYSMAPAAFALVGLPGGLTLEELKGAKIAVPVGTEAHFLLAKILEEQQLSLADIQLVNLLVPDGIAALQSKQVDGAMVVEPVLSRLTNAGQIQVIRDGAGLFAGLTVTVVREDLVDSPVVDLFKQAHRASLDFMEANPDYVMEIAARESNLPIPVLEKIAPKYSFDVQDVTKIREILAETVEFLYDEGIIRRKISVDELVHF